MSDTSVLGLLDRLTATAPDVGSEAGRQSMLASARALVSALESPVERAARICWHEPTIEAAIRVGVDLKLFEKMIGKKGSPQSSAELAKLTQCDPRLLERLLKHLATHDIVQETGPDTYAPNGLTGVFADPMGAGMLINCHDALTVIKSKLVPFLRARKYQNPTEKRDSAWRYASGTNLDYFEWVFGPGNEDQATAFNNHMKFKTLAPKWYETMQVQDVLGAPSADTDVLLVDVGGNTGYDALGFHRAHPEYPGRLIVQDRPNVIDAADAQALKSVELMKHDFFTPQPIHGAKAYYLKMVLHDWPDAECRTILENLKPALKPGYSRILINEIVIPKQGADWFSTSVDMLMMFAHSSYERREEAWSSLLESVGLKIVKIWECGSAPEKIIEVDLL